MVSGNPYNVTQIYPGLADSFGVTSGNPSINGGNTVITVHLRSDVYWQDIPFQNRAAYTVDGGSELNGPFINKTLSPLDIAFNIEYLRDMDYWYGTDNGILIDDVNQRCHEFDLQQHQPGERLAILERHGISVGRSVVQQHRHSRRMRRRRLTADNVAVQLCPVQLVARREHHPALPDRQDAMADLLQRPSHTNYPALHLRMARNGLMGKQCLSRSDAHWWKPWT